MTDEPISLDQARDTARLHRLGKLLREMPPEPSAGPTPPRSYPRHRWSDGIKWSVIMLLIPVFKLVEFLRPRHAVDHGKPVSPTTIEDLIEPFNRLPPSSRRDLALHLDLVRADDGESTYLVRTWLVRAKHADKLDDLGQAIQEKE